MQTCLSMRNHPFLSPPLSLSLSRCRSRCFLHTKIQTINFNPGHWTYECKGKATYTARVSRTKILENPHLKPKFHLDLPPDEADKKVVDKKAKGKGTSLTGKGKKRRREESSTSSSSSSSGSSSGSDSSSDSDSGSQIDSESDTGSSGSSRWAVMEARWPG